MNNSGQFKKGNKAASKEKRKQSKKSSYFMKTSNINVILPIEKKETDVNIREFIPFGLLNLFPQDMAELNRVSVVSRRITSSKAFWVMGKGFTSSNEVFNEWQKSVNPKESLREIGKKIKLDKFRSGNAWIEIIANEETDEVRLNHIDTVKCRISEDGTMCMIHPDWSKFDSHKNLTVELPLFPEFTPSDSGIIRSIFHYKEYESMFDHYGIPSNIAGLDGSEIGWKTNKWNISRLDNAFNVSGLLEIFSNFSDEDAKSFKDDVNEEFTGYDNITRAGKQGKLLTVINELGSGEPGEKTNFTPIPSNEDGNWMDLHKQSAEEQVVANSWYPSLSGLKVASGFSNDVIQSEYEVALSSTIMEEQESFLEIIKRILSDFNFGDLDDVEFINKSPVDVDDTLTGPQVDSMMDVLTKVKLQEITKDQGIQVLIHSFDMTIEEANKFFE